MAVAHVAAAADVRLSIKVRALEAAELASVHFHWTLLADAAYSAISEDCMTVATRSIEHIRSVVGAIARADLPAAGLLTLCDALLASSRDNDKQRTVYLLGQAREAIRLLQERFARLPRDTRDSTLSEIASELEAILGSRQ